MRIVRVELENVKSYKRADIEFKYGTNAICGQNGAGKSTLLEAIGFALFDYLAVTQDDFVRRGEKTATVTVAVEAGDGRVYEVVRRCGSSSAYYVYDAELGRHLTDGKAETMLWLQNFLRMDASADLATLFRDAIGVPQGLLTAAFLETPSRRKDVFNPLLRVDEYERVWSELRDPRRWLDLQITDQEKIIAGLQGQVAALPDTQDRAASLTSDIENAEQLRETQQSALDDVIARVEAFAEGKRDLDALNQALSKSEIEVEALNHRMEDGAKALKEAETARAIIDETQEGFEIYESTQRTLKDLESDRTDRDRLQGNLRVLERDLALVSQRLVDLDEELASVEAAQAKMAQLAPNVERQTDLEKALDEARLQADRLKSARHSLEGEERRLAHMRSQLERMGEEIEERELIEREIVGFREELADIEADRETLAAELASSETAHAHLASELEASEARLEEMQSVLARAEESLNGLRERASEVKEGLEARTDAENALSEARSRLERLGAKIEVITADQAAQRTTLEQTEARVAALETGADGEAACPVCGQTLTQAHREELLARYDAELTQCRQTLDELKTKRDTIAEQREGTLKEIRDLESTLQTLPRPGDAEEIDARIAAEEHGVESYRSSVDETLETVSRLASQWEGLETDIADLKGTLETRNQVRTSLLDEIRARESHVDTLPRPIEIDQLRARITDQSSVVEERSNVVTQLEGAPDRVLKLDAQLESLGNPRRDYQRASDIASRRSDIARTRAETEARLATLEAEATTLENELDAYANLDARITDERSILNRYEEDHRRYVAHLREAEALEGYRDTYERVKAELSEAEQALERTRKAWEEARAAYDAEAHAAARDTLGNLRESLAALNERLHQRQNRLSEVEAEIDHLEALASELEDAEEERADLQALQDLLGYLRGILREAGPVITRRLVDVISLRADRLYREIMQDYATRLRWTEDYDIILKQSGRERSFQQLSGGEQMAAALAVRLALLQEVSAVDVAFFDEPTANLDDRRRDNLAEQILDIKGFNQLFVISHDDTFEQDTDHVVRVRKVEGVSQVEV